MTDCKCIEIISKKIVELKELKQKNPNFNLLCMKCDDEVSLCEKLIEEINGNK